MREKETNMKRVTLTIHSEKQPDVIYMAYALSNEVNDASLNFFSTVKFQPEEELEIRVDYGQEPVRYHVVMTHLHEQISSGKIMTSIPDEAHPYPGRTFYRCFTKVKEKVAGMTPVEEVPAETPATEAPEVKAA
jgi:hypothetical protein